MTDKTINSNSGNVTETERLAFEKWHKALLRNMVREMQRVGAVEQGFSEAQPAWVLPHRLLIGKVRVLRNSDQFIWVISGDNFTTDHIDATLAATPREAARYFYMKWQLDAERLHELVDQHVGNQTPEVDRSEVAKKLAMDADALSEVEQMDELWASVET